MKHLLGIPILTLIIAYYGAIAFGVEDPQEAFTDWISTLLTP